ncbi:MAG: hypothetical protein II517_04175 [Ruminococcus sp.]|jgi:hypothetical protein|nr:hypothetical protein [Ruminococcus sp.]
MNINQEWYKSWALWLSLAALVVYVVKVTAKVDISPVVNGLMDVLLPVLVGFGVVNNPNVANRWVAKDGDRDDQ